MIVKGEDRAYPEDRHPGALQVGLNIAQEECIGSVFMGIKAIIQSKVDEIHSRFQDNFSTLEHEVHKRDEIIYRLQRRIQELERNADRRKSRNGSSLLGDDDSRHDMGGHEGDNEMDDVDGDLDDEEELLLGSEASVQRRFPLELQTSYLFSRGDSIDTVISAQDYDDEVFERSDLERGEASQAFVEARSSQHYHQHRRSRDLGNGDGQQHSSATWAQISEEETIEMREFGTAPWQVEFHRDRDSLPPPNERTFGTRSIDKDSVAVDIGNTSTEYESSSSSEGAKGGKKQDSGQEVAHRRMKEEPVALEDDDEEEGDQTDVGSEEEETDDTTDEDEPQLTNKNWEVQMLAKEMDKFEKTRPDNSEILGEAQHLQNEIRQMRDAVTSGELSPSELDMLESMLQTKSKRVKALAKALSVETPFSPSAPGASGAAASSSMASQEASKSKTKFPFVRSVDDLPGASRTSPLTRRNQLQSLAPSQLPTSSAYSQQPRLSLGILPSISSTSAQPSTSTAASERLSPGEERELQELLYTRKRSTLVRRQTSLDPAPSAATPSTAITESQRRRESAGSVPAGSHMSSTKSFFSKFSLVRQLTHRGSKNPERDPVSGEQARVKYVRGIASTEAGESSTRPRKSSTEGSVFIHGASDTTGDSTAQLQQRRSSTADVLPSISSTITTTPVLSRSVQSEPGSFQAHGRIPTTTVAGGTMVSEQSASTSTTTMTASSSSAVVSSSTTPSAQVPCSSKMAIESSATHSELGGESQPLLKK